MINFCTVCYTCKGSGKCVQKDGMAEVFEKMIEAYKIVKLV